MRRKSPRSLKRPRSGSDDRALGVLRVDAANATSPNSAVVLGSGGTSGTLALNGNSTVIGGYDNAGWTLDGYVIPRLQSGLYFAKEVSG